MSTETPGERPEDADAQDSPSNRMLPEKLQGEQTNPSAWLLKRIWKRVNRQNMHFMGCLVGQEGSGKSYTAIRIAKELDPTFTADRVLFDVVDLLEILKDGEHEKGNAYVLDEAGVQFGVRTWQERSQILANQALQIIRDENLILWFTLPTRGELDSQADNRLQALYEITEKEHDEYVRGKWIWLDKDRISRNGKTYNHYPKRVQGGKKRYRSIAFTPPDDEVIEPYRERKDQFQAEMYEKTIEEFRDEDETAEADNMSPKEIAKHIADSGDISEFIMIDKRNGEPYIQNELVRAEYEISQADSRAVKSLLERDYDLTTFVE